MPTNILMPALSPTMEEGKLAKWLKNEGDEVKAGDVIAEIETDKATMEVEAVDEGKLQKILVPAGTEAVKVNEPIAVILGEGEDPSAVAAPAPKPAAAPRLKPHRRPLRKPRGAGRRISPGTPRRLPAASPAPAPAQPCRRARPGDRRAHLRQPAGPAPGGGRRHRSRRAQRQRPPWPHRQGGYRGGPGTRSRGQAGRRACGHSPLRRPPQHWLAAPALSAAAVAGTTPYHLLPATTMRKVIARRMVGIQAAGPAFLSLHRLRARPAR